MNLFNPQSWFTLFITLFILTHCKPKTQIVENQPDTMEVEATIEAPDTISIQEELAEVAPSINYDSIIDELPDTALVDLSLMDDQFILDVKYATIDNFTKDKLYECEKCLLRKKVAQQLVLAHDSLQKIGYRIKLFDCYRPNFIQWMMWKKVPDPRYVADPAKGSVHNRGGAVDLSLTDLEGNEFEMGSAYDHFGRSSHFAYTDLPEEVLERRKLLRSVLEHFGFGGITSEWWHFSYRKRGYNILNNAFECDE